MVSYYDCTCGDFAEGCVVCTRRELLKEVEKKIAERMDILEKADIAFRGELLTPQYQELHEMNVWVLSALSGDRK